MMRPLTFHPFRPPLSMLCLLALLFGAGALFAATPDVRLLIDVSGSMRQNDPENLRVPALRLVDELLPLGANAGVWLFAEKTEVLAPPGKVDKKWKTRTGARLDRIHSRGLFTDIEKAIDAALLGWDTPDEDSDRHIVLLTDGLVDVSKDAEQSAASRARILSEQLDRLKALGVKVHAVALSDNVDTQLMRTLASQTDGWLETAKDAGALQRIFLHMLEQTAAPTTVPLEGNGFEIDEQVSEFTLLAFPGAGASTSLVSPSGETISASQPGQGAVWRAEAGYDLVTLKAPKPGRWQLEGIPDPDNRVVVVTDLGMDLAPFPTALLNGENPGIEAWLTDHGQPVSRPDLLQFVTAKAKITAVSESESGETEEQAQPADETAPDAGTEAADQPEESVETVPPSELPLEQDPETGRYRADLDTKLLAPGIYQLQVMIDGGTFKRQVVKRVKIIGPPVNFRYQQQLPSDETPSAALIIALDIERDLIDPKSLFGYLRMRGPKGEDAVADLSGMTKSTLILTLPVARPGEYRTEGRLMVRTTRGDTVEFEPNPRSFVFEFVPPAPAVDQDSPDTALSWLDLALYILGGNAVLALLLGLTWWLLQRSKGNAGTAPAKTKQPKSKQTKASSA